MESLRQKFRDVRRPMVNNKKVKAMKHKYGFIRSNSSTPRSATSSEQEDCPSYAKKKLTVRVGYFVMILPQLLRHVLIFKFFSFSEEVVDICHLQI